MSDWFTELPTQWKIARLCDHAEIVNGYPFDSELFHVTEGMPLVRIRDISKGRTEVRFAGDQVDEAMIHRGDILVGMDGDFNVARWQGNDALLNQRVCCIRPGNTMSASLIEYMLPLPLKIINDLTYSTTVKHLSSLDVSKIRFPLPPPEEQRAIANFLDRETAQLDALAAAKQRWLNLLAEKRRALITRAVTRGLNPTTPLRDSGLAWLGQIPDHWQVKRLKFVSPFITVGIVVTPSKYYEVSGVPCLRSLNVKESGLVAEDLVFISNVTNEELSKSKVYAGDLVVVRSGQPGTTAVVDERFEGANCIDLIIIRRSEKANSCFLGYFLNSEVARAEFGGGSGGAIQQHFNIEAARDLAVALPPPDEQHAIVAHISAKTAKLDALITATERTIALLKERRAALIAAAVTGKLQIK